MFVPRKTRPATVTFSDKAPVFFAFLAVLTILLVATVPAHADEPQSPAATSTQDNVQVALAPADRMALPAEPQTSEPALADWAQWDEPIEGGSGALNLNLGLGGIVPTATTGDRGADQIAHIASCHAAANGRYHSDQQSAVIADIPDLGTLEAAKVAYYTRQAREEQFADCTRF